MISYNNSKYWLLNRTKYIQRSGLDDVAIYRVKKA